MRKLDGSLEHPGNHPQAIQDVEIETTRKMPNSYRIVGSLALVSAILSGSAFVVGSAIKGLIHRDEVAAVCEVVDPFKIADTYEGAASRIKMYQLGPERSYEETLDLIMPGGGDVELCERRDLRVLNQLEANYGIGFYQEPPIEPKAQLDN